MHSNVLVVILILILDSIDVYTRFRKPCSFLVFFLPYDRSVRPWPASEMFSEGLVAERIPSHPHTQRDSASRLTKGLKLGIEIGYPPFIDHTEEIDRS